MKTVPEESTAWLTVTFKDKDGANQAPSSAEYRVDSKGGTELKDWTSISSPSAEQEITLVPADNKIVDSDLFNDKYQYNIVTVRGIFGANDERNEKYEYKVEALGQIPKP